MDDSVLKTKQKISTPSRCLISSNNNIHSSSFSATNVTSLEKSESNFVNFEPAANATSVTTSSSSNKKQITNASSLSLLTSHMMSSSSSLLDVDSSKKLVISKVISLIFECYFKYFPIILFVFFFWIEIFQQGFFD